MIAMKSICNPSVAKNGRLEPIGPIVYRVMADLEMRASQGLLSPASEAEEDRQGKEIESLRPASVAHHVPGNRGTD